MDESYKAKYTRGLPFDPPVWLGSSSNDDKRIQSIESIETYAYGTRKNLASEKEEIKCSNIIKWYKRWFTLVIIQKKT